MKLAEYLGYDIQRENGKPKIIFKIRCPHCGEVEGTPYWIKFQICPKCGKLSKLPDGDIFKIVRLFNKFYENPYEFKADDENLWC